MCVGLRAAHTRGFTRRRPGCACADGLKEIKRYV
jgi:hypothetical protein